VNKYAEMHVPAWLRVSNCQDRFSIRCHREGVAEPSIQAAMGHSAAVHAWSYRTITQGIISRDFATTAGTLPLPETIAGGAAGQGH